jgi:hypothetical protein
MRALHTFLGSDDMMAHLAMMAPRLVGLRRVLKPTGPLYLHCDPTASHYLKLLLDAVLGSLQRRTSGAFNSGLWAWSAPGPWSRRVYANTRPTSRTARACNRARSRS